MVDTTTHTRAYNVLQHITYQSRTSLYPLPQMSCRSSPSRNKIRFLKYICTAHCGSTKLKINCDYCIARGQIFAFATRLEGRPALASPSFRGFINAICLLACGYLITPPNDIPTSCHIFEPRRENDWHLYRLSLARSLVRFQSSSLMAFGRMT